MKNIVPGTRSIDMTGMTFGRLCVLKMAGVSKFRIILWECQCSCGAKKIINGMRLRNGSTKSCGCLQREKASQRATNLLGQSFGRLSVVKKLNMRWNGSVVWKCLCLCGKSVNVSSQSLINGNTKSCGCAPKGPKKTHGLTGTKEYGRFLTAKRKERKRNLDSAWSPLMELCLSKLQPSCVICGCTEKLCTDHVLPLSKGYGLNPGNAVRLCRSCNARKAARYLDQLPIEWQQKITYAAESFRVAWSGGF